jgi:hypothetical protein
MEEALRHIAGTISAIELTGEPEYDTPNGVYGLTSLPVRLTG